MNIPSRLHCLDAARGFAAFSVVLWHWQHFFYSAPGVKSTDFQKESQPLYEILASFYNHGGGNAVSFFFMLSGFVFFWLYGERIKAGTSSLKSFWLARFSRLYPLHFATLILVTILQFFYHREHQNYFVYPFNDSHHFGLNLILGSHWGFEKGYSFNAPIWSVSVEIGLYVAFFFIVAAGKASWRYIVSFIVLLILSRKLGFYSQRWSGPLEIFFWGGFTFYALRFYLSHAWRRRFSDWVLIALPIIAWVIIAVSDNISTIVLTRYCLLARCVFPATIFGLVMLELTAKVPFYRIKWMGACTYSSYLLHFPLQLLFLMAAPLVFSNVDDAFYSPWMLLVFFITLICLSLITFHLFEVPLQNYIRRIGKRFLKIEQVGADNGDKRSA